MPRRLWPPSSHYFGSDSIRVAWLSVLIVRFVGETVLSFDKAGYKAEFMPQKTMEKYKEKLYETAPFIVVYDDNVRFLRI